MLATDAIEGELTTGPQDPMSNVSGLLLGGRFLAAKEAALELTARDKGFPAYSLAFRALAATRSIDELKALMAALPTFASTNAANYRTLSSQCAEKGQTQFALVLAIAAIAMKPDEPDYWVHLSSLLCGQNFLYEAKAAAETAIRQPSAPSIAHRLLSAICAMLGDFDLAIREAETAIRLDPDIVDYRVHAAGMLINAGRPQRALFHLAYASALHKESAVVWRLIGEAHLSAGDIGSAIEAAAAAARLSTSEGEFLDNLLLVSQNGVATSAADGPVLALESVGTRRFIVDWSELDALVARERFTPANFVRGLKAQWRVLSAIALREIVTTYSTSSVGYFWALFEPASHVILLYTIFVLVGHASQPPLGDTMIVFYLTGLFPYLSFAHGTEKAMHAVGANSSLLSMPKITPLDILTARVGLSVLTDLCMLLATTSAMALAGHISVPDKIMDMVSAYLACWCFTYGVALFVGAMSSYADWLARIWPSFLRVQYFTCGIFYHPSGMPKWVIDYLSWNPMLHVLEWFRQGYFRGYTSPFLSKTYLLTWAIGMVFIGLVSERALRGKLRHER